MWKIQSIIIALDGQNVRYYWIPNFGDAYIVGDDGSVWSRNLKVGMKWVLSDNWKRLAPGLDSHGYPIVGLCYCGVSYSKGIHQLVCEAEYGPCLVGMEVCHNNSNPLNNNWWNLRYDTRSGNYIDRINNGTYPSGEHNYSAKLNWKKVREIRVKHATGKYTYKDLALEYGVRQQTIWCVVNKITWVEEYDLVS